MNTSLRLILAAFLLGMAAIIGPTSARAATFQDRGYVLVEVPDISQAVAFFQGVLGCPLISPRLYTTDEHVGQSAAALLSCGSGSVVELSLSARSQRHTSRRGAPLQLGSDDVTGATQWLRHRGVPISGAPQRLASGQLAVNFVTPWGQSLQLVGWSSAVASTGH